MKYFTITGIITHIAVILYLIFSFILGDFNFINWEQDHREFYIGFLGVFSVISYWGVIFSDTK
jgi:hypothetical protein